MSSYSTQGVQPTEREVFARPAEEWRHPLGLEDYSVSTLGNISRFTRSQGARNGHQLKPSLIKGRPSVKLPNVPRYMRPFSTKQDAKYHCMAVARLVLYTFIGPPPWPICEVGYRDGDKKNVALTNLYWTEYEDSRVQQRLNMESGRKKGHAMKAEARRRENLETGETQMP